MLKQVVILLALAMVVLAAPAPDDHHHKHKHHHHKHDKHHHKHDKHHSKPSQPKVVYGGEILPWVPFPHFDGIAMYEFVEGLTLLPGSAFVTVRADGSCDRVQLGDEQGGFCPLNQTVCDQIASTPCAAAVANVTCFEAPKAGQTPAPGQPTDVPEAEFGNGYPLGGPLCHVEAFGLKIQPSSYTALFSLSPKVQTCVFQVAPPPTRLPGALLLPADPPCRFVEQ